MRILRQGSSFIIRTILFFINKLKIEKGTTLFELVITIILLGIAIPAVLPMIGQMAIHNIKNESIYRSMSLASAKMEEIVAFKHINNLWAVWANTITDYAGTETLADGSQRTVTVTLLNNWINDGGVVKDAYQVDVVVTSPIGPGYSTSVIFVVNF